MNKIEEYINGRIDFLTDHWVEGDKPPFNFGGWREEVVADIALYIEDRGYMFTEVCTNLYGGKVKMKITNENFAELLRNVRKKKHLSQKGLGRRFGVTYKAVSAWEIGKSMPSSKILLGVVSFIEANV